MKAFHVNLVKDLHVSHQFLKFFHSCCPQLPSSEKNRRLCCRFLEGSMSVFSGAGPPAAGAIGSFTVAVVVCLLSFIVHNVLESCPAFRKHVLLHPRNMPHNISLHVFEGFILVMSRKMKCFFSHGQCRINNDNDLWSNPTDSQQFFSQTVISVC